jgi:hypothetical protein
LQNEPGNYNYNITSDNRASGVIMPGDIYNGKIAYREISYAVGAENLNVNSSFFMMQSIIHLITSYLATNF